MSISLWPSFAINPFSMAAQRKRLAAKVPDGPLKTFLTTPIPAPHCAIGEAPLLVLDFETTAISARTGELLSVGFVEINHLAISLGSSQHFLVKPEHQSTTGDKPKQHQHFAKSATIHQITAQESQQGYPLDVVIEKLLNAMSGRIVVAHFATIEQSFLAKACKQLYGFAPIYPIIDTLALAKRRLDQRQVAYDPSALRLTNLRASYQLPSHYAHNALNDAVATAELLLAELAHHHHDTTSLAKLLR